MRGGTVTVVVAPLLLLLLLGQCGHAIRARNHVQLQTKGNPVAEVITLLQDLQAQSQDEGAEEAKTYEEFACFCKDTTKEKSKAIEEDQTEIDTFSSTLEEKTALKVDLQKQIADQNDLISTIEKDMAEAQAKRDAAKTKYEVLAADMEKAVTSIEGAKARMTQVSADTPAELLQVKEAIRKSLIHADALGLSPRHARTLAALLQQDGDDGTPEADFEFHHEDLMETFDGLDKSYHEKKEDVDDTEAKAVEAHTSFMKAKTNQLETAQDELSRQTEDLNVLEEEIGAAESDLSNAKAKLDDDQTYLKDLTAKCELKAREWDQRSAMRAQELAALSQALAVITDTVQEKATVNERAFVQQPPVDEKEEGRSGEEQQDEEDDADDEEDVSFLQAQHLPKRHVGALLRHAQEEDRPAPAAPPPALEMSPEVAAPKGVRGAAHVRTKAKVVELLRSKGVGLSSPVLSSLALRVAEDPFKSVKSLVQGLVNKLLEEANEEAGQKGWCDTELAKSKNARDSEYATVKKLNAQVEMLEAERDRLSDAVTTLGNEIVELNDSLSTVTENRAQEKEENRQTLQTAREGHDAVAEAIGILQKFYKTAAKAEAVELLQKKEKKASPVDPDAPEVHSGAYQGNQAGSSGILGLLAVIKSDFERTIKVTRADEEEAERAFVEFSATTKATLAAKDTEKGAKETDLTEAAGQINEAMADLEEHQKLVDDALKELESLKPACIDTGMSWEDRKAKRQEEIEALQNALCILDTEGVEDGCK